MQKIQLRLLKYILFMLISFFFLTGAANPLNPALDWMTGLPREPIHIKEWPGKKKVAVCFILFVEDWGQGQGPSLRNDLIKRTPDFVNESFRQYAIKIGVPRVGRIFNEEKVPLSIALNAQYPEKHPDVWQVFRSSVPHAPIIAHGINNSTDMLPLTQGIAAQTSYIQQTLNRIEKSTGVKSQGWSSPSVYANAQTFSASRTAGVSYSLDAMDSDTLSRLKTQFGDLILIPYPTTTVDMGQYFQRLQQPQQLAQLWIDYVTGLVNEAESHPERDATVIAIGIHPFVIGTPDGALALRQVLQHFKKQHLVWVTDVQAIVNVVNAS